MQQVFTHAHQQLLTAVLNRIIPAEGAMPGAGEFSLAKFMEDSVADRPTMARIFNQGLSNIEIAGAKSGTGGFCDLPGQDQDEALRSVESSDPVFFQELVRQTYNGYYTHPQIFQAMGYSPYIPTPEDKPELLDESLLEKQRQRAPFWTKV